MKLWGWWKNEQGSNQQKPLQQGQQLDQVPHEHAHLKPDDLEGRAALERAARPNVKDTLKTISADDFKNANKIPCLRSAILTGAGIGSTVGLVMYLSRRPLGKSANWAFAGFFVGSIFSWEQCRFRLRQGKLNVVNARQQYAKKE